MYISLSILAIAGTALAHKPTFSDDFSGPDLAYEVADPEVSIVVYQEITCETDQLWFTFEAKAGFPLYIQLGVPEIERLVDYRPSVALLAPGLPAATDTLPFEVPDGLGVQVFHSDNVDEPGAFYEEFTQTSSWVLVEETVTLPEDGTGYLVAWDPAGWTGKLWLATGTVEDFSDVDSTDFIYWGEAVNDFHETGRYDRVEPTEESFCGDAVNTPEYEANDTAPTEGGCAVVSGSAGIATGIAMIAVARRRERRTA